MSRDVSKGKVLIVAEDLSTADFLGDALEFAGLETQRVGDVGRAIEEIGTLDFSLMIAELRHSTMLGDELLAHAHRIDSDLAIVFSTGPGDVPLAVRCLREGASDYLLQPYDTQEVAIRARRAIEMRSLRIAERNSRLDLQKQVDAQRERLMDLTKNSLKTLAHALEAKDLFTRDHSERVAALATDMAQHLYPTDTAFHESVRLGAQLHDIGKIGVSEAALAHPGTISEELFQEIKRHPVIGEDILRPIIRDEDVLGAVRHHHEHFNGTGYPDGLRGTSIPLSARIVAVADAYDAMVSARPFREAKSKTEALSILSKGAGEQWDPDVVGAIMHLRGLASYA